MFRNLSWEEVKNGKDRNLSMECFQVGKEKERKQHTVRVHFPSRLLLLPALLCLALGGGAA
jgi:hypothetical protein